MMIFDGHCDIFTGVLQRRLQGETEVLRRRHLPLLRQGGIAGGCFVLWVDPPYTADPAARMAQLLEAVTAELAECEEVTLVHDLAEIEAAQAAGQFYILLGAEGLAAIGDSLEKLDRLIAFGLRHAMLTWNEANALATGAKGDPSRGLTPAGRQVLRHLEGQHIIVDVSHLNEASFWDVLRHSQGPIIASHSNARAINDMPRNLSDEQLRAIAAQGGLVGLNANKTIVSQSAAAQHIDTLVRHAVHMAEVMGVAHLALGLDFNEYLDVHATSSYNAGGNPNVPGLEDCRRTPDLLAQLRAAGFNDDELAQIAWKNWHRLIGQVLG